MSASPTAGRIVHFRTANGWRPLHVTSGQGGMVSGWVMLDPDDDEARARVDLNPNTFRIDAATAFKPVTGACEGEAEGNWRWPPRVEQS